MPCSDQRIGKNYGAKRELERTCTRTCCSYLYKPVRAQLAAGSEYRPFRCSRCEEVRGTSGRLDWKCRDVPMPMPSVVPIDTRPPAQPGILFLPRHSRLIFLSFLLSVFLILLLLLPFQPSRRPWFVCSVFSKSPPAAASPIVKSTIRL